MKDIIDQIDKAINFKNNNDFIKQAIEYGIIEKTGLWFNYKDIMIGVGIGRVEEYFKSNPEKIEEVKNEINLKKSLKC